MAGERHYFTDPESAAEMARLVRLGTLTTKGMGGTLSAEQRAALPEAPRILDLACGPGEWALQLAHELPDAEVVGVDISEIMINYAMANARAQNKQNVSFEVADVTKPFAFSSNYFDLINGRLFAFFSVNLWPAVLQECLRVTRPGGFIRLTESEWGITNSLAYERYTELFFGTLKRAGQSFSPTGRLNGITAMMDRLLQDAGYINRALTPHIINFSAGAEMHEPFRQNFMIFFKLIQPFIVNLGMATQEEVDQLYETLSIDMLSDNFCGVMFLLSVWGQKPPS